MQFCKTVKKRKPEFKQNCWASWVKTNTDQKLCSDSARYANKIHTFPLWTLCSGSGTMCTDVLLALADLVVLHRISSICHLFIFKCKKKVINRDVSNFPLEVTLWISIHHFNRSRVSTKISKRQGIWVAYLIGLL